MKLCRVFLLINFCVFNAFAAEPASFDIALESARIHCSGISSSMDDLKRMAGINTTVTGIGTAVGAGATISGIVKSKTDKSIEEIKNLLDRYKMGSVEGASVTNTGFDKTKVSKLELATAIKDYGLKKSDDAVKNPLEEQLKKEQQKSETLGNVRTGLMATSTVANIAGAVMASKNRADDDLITKIQNCIKSVESLENAKLQAHVVGELESSNSARADRIIKACGEYEFADLSVINKKSDGATISSAIGAVTGLSGTITSGMANKKTDNADREKNLNKASNILGGATTAASLTATVFNATQINAIKKIVDIADECEGALK